MKPFVQGLAEVKPHDPFEEAQTGSKPQAHPSKGLTYCAQDRTTRYSSALNSFLLK